MSKTSATIDRRSMPVSAWPEQDRALWQAACEAGGPLDDAGAAADWAPATRRGRVANYGRWLTFIDQQGLLAPDAAPGDRVTPDVVRRYIDALRPTLAPLSLWTTIDQLAAIMPALAPDADWGWLRRTAGRLKRGAANQRPVRRASATPPTSTNAPSPPSPGSTTSPKPGRSPMPLPFATP